jgi:hypothetical protein
MHCAKKSERTEHKKGLKEIVQEDYLASLQKLADTKWKSLKGEQYINREAKTNAYLLQKGYERPGDTTGDRETQVWK